MIPKGVKLNLLIGGRAQPLPSMKVRRLELDFNPLLLTIETLLHTPSLLPPTPSGIPRIGASTCPLPSSSENFNLFRYRSGLVSISQFVTAEEFSTASYSPPKLKVAWLSRKNLGGWMTRQRPTSHDLHNSPSYRIKNQTDARAKVRVPIRAQASAEY